MNFYKNVLNNLPQYNELLDAAKKLILPVMVTGLSPVHKAHFIFGTAEDAGKPVLIIAEDETAARRMCADVNEMAGGEFAFLYPQKDPVFRNVEGVSREYEYIRLGVLSKIISNECRVVFTSAAAAMQYTIPPEELARRNKEIKTGDVIKLKELSEILQASGYIRRPQVEGIAQYSVRGGIIDFFPPDSAFPVRVEFWGDEIDGIATFELESQRRNGTADCINIPPASDVLFENEEAALKKLKNLLDSLGMGKQFEAARKVLESDINNINSGLGINNMDKYISLAYEKPATLFDYLKGRITFVSEWHSVKENAKNYQSQLNEDIKILLEDGELNKGITKFSMETGELHQIIGNSANTSAGTIYLDTFVRSNPDLKLRKIITAQAMQTSAWSGDIKFLQDDLNALIGMKYAVAVLTGTVKSASILAEDLRKAEIPADYSADFQSIVRGKVHVMKGTLTSGFEYPEIKTAVITHSAAAHVVKHKPVKRKKSEEIRSITEISKGDPVVHTSYGIGIFDGIHKMEVQGITKDYIKIKYAGADVLYVPVTQLDLVSRYIGPKDGTNVKLNKLNSGEWHKARSRVKKAVDDMADELIKLYAERAKIKGFAFSEDSEWQKEFEQHFEYEETEDQLRCIEEIKHDMQKDVPMDRLLCGDVGFGKTEVALRGAFKCVLDSKQCAILCPTTILAWQHYQTVSRRIANFPVNIELLSRFKSPKEQKEIVKKLARGEIDIIIGTHRIIQKDIEFKNLGLAVIDEEQRFGVTHKERFKEIFKGVDVLTLSATPIPRTLNMALSGIRDMSVIEQAPQDRYPVQTYVIEHDDGIVSEALKKELRRGGQVYYIHNRIETIERCASRIAAMVPDARIGLAHGQMREDELSKIWQMLMENQIDILICTTIIETGVDVSNCNTLIIEDSDKMGLSQLYQLRGRVGRSNRRAFAYLTFRRGKSLSEIAEKRLSAIKEFTNFGSGFRIAMRDLEIRGAGSILGERQHGHMESVGYDMYVRLLSDAICEKRGEVPDHRTEECLVDIQIEAHIPEDYIDNLTQRIDIYRKIAAIRTAEDSRDVIDEMIDRFGEPPESVTGLVDIALIRNMAGKFGFVEIGQKNNMVILYPKILDMDIVRKMVNGFKGRVMVSTGTSTSVKPGISVKIENKGAVIETLREIMDVLESGTKTADM